MPASTSQSVLALAHYDDAKQMQIESRTCQACLGNYAEMQLCLSKVIYILPHSPIWFVIYPHWFVNAAFLSPNTQQLLKTSIKSSLFFPNSCTTQIKVVSLHRQSSPSLLTMLKSCEAFLFMAHLIPFIKQLTLSSFSRHGIAQASLALLIWLNENVLFISRTCHLASFTRLVYRRPAESRGLSG